MESILLLLEKQTKYGQSGKVLERLLHCIWSEQLFRKTLQLQDKKLQISSPGWWNLEAGPDFRNAELFIEGQRVCGDVEIHLHSSDWYHHHHHEDPRYNDVILHVVLYGSHSVCSKQNGEPVPELELKDLLLEEIKLLQQRIPVHQFPFGPGSGVRLCRRFLQEQDEGSILRILDSAGDLRMQRKKDRFLERIRQCGFDQAFYEAILEGMGYKQSRYAFRELAQRVPLEELLTHDLSSRRGIDAMAAILLGTAGLLQELSSTKLEPDPETSAYINELFRYWNRVRNQFESRQLNGFCWYPSSTRPANFPARRLTAVAAFFHYHRNNVLKLLLQSIETVAEGPKKQRIVLKNWLELTSRPLHLYWSYHYQFERRKFAAPKRLIGRERGKIVIVNVILPALLAYAQTIHDVALEKTLHEVYRRHPKLGENCITRLMSHRLFGDQDKAKHWIGTAHRQQALHHFFFDFCDNRDALCSRCELNNDGLVDTEE